MAAGARAAGGVPGAGIALAPARRSPHRIRKAAVALAAAAALGGVTARARRERLAYREERAARRERERVQGARLAAAEERARIARELHDIVTHSLSAVVALADGAAMVRAADPGRADEAMRQV